MLRDEIDTIILEDIAKGNLVFNDDYKNLAKAIEERLTELGYVKLSELELDKMAVEYVANFLCEDGTGRECCLPDLTEDSRQIHLAKARKLINTLSTAKGIIGVKEL